MRLKLLPKCLFALVCLVVIGSVQTHASDITKDEIKQIINESSDCDTLDQIAIDHLEFADLLGDGKNEAVVVGSTCMTGTAGPDVHAVYMRDSNGKLVEHSLDRIDPVTGSNLRVEAAAWRGRPVSFEMVGPWSPRDRMSGITRSLPVAQMVLIYVLFVAAGFLAWHNLRRPRISVSYLVQVGRQGIRR